MSIQGSVNQLLTIGGSFAGMYGLLHPEIAQARQVIHDLKGAKTADKLSQGYFNVAQDYEETDPNKSADYYDKASKYEDIANKSETNIQKRIEENPSLLDNKKVLKAYEDKVDYDNIIRKVFGKQKAQIALETEGMSKVKQDKVSASNPNKRIVVNPYVKATQSLEMEGNNKVLQQQLQAQRRKDKGEI